MASFERALEPAPQAEPLAPTLEHLERPVAEGEVQSTDATGVWADSRTTLTEAEPAATLAAASSAFLDPGAWALANHRAPLLERESISVGPIDGASADLSSAPAQESAAAPSGGTFAE